MTEPGDPVSRRYRELAREEPSSALDAAILASARKSVGARPRSAARWMGPVSIAAVLVLGIGVSLRMQLEQPGIETAVPPPVQSQYSAPAAPPAKPPASEPAPAQESSRDFARDAVSPAKRPVKEDRMAQAAPKPQAQRRDEPAAAAGAGARSETQAVTPSEANPFADGPVAMQQAPSGATTPSASLGYAPPLEEKTRAKLSADLARAPAAAAGSVATAPAAAPAAAPAPAAVAPATIAAAPAPPPAPVAPSAAPAPQASPAPPTAARAAARPAAPAYGAAPQPKREALEANTAERELRKSIVAPEPDPDPARELERIAKLREAGAQREADQALEAFRRRHPGFRIPEAMWERVKPR